MNIVNLKAHAAVKFIPAALQVIGALDSEKTALAAVEELKSQLEYLEWIFDQSDPALVTKNELDALAAAANQAKAHVDGLAGDANSQAQAATAQLAAFFHRFPYPRFRKIPRSESQRIIDEVQSQATSVFQIIETERASLTQSVSDLEKKIADNTAESKSLFERYKEIESSQEELVAEISTMLTAKNVEIKTRIEDKLSDANTRLSKAIDDFQSATSEHRGQASALLSDIGAERKKAIETSGREASESLATVKNEAADYLKKIRELYGISGGEASAGALIQSANREQNAYRLLGLLAFLAFMTGSIFAYRAIEPALTGQVQLEVVIGRAGLVIASFIPAWFLASLAMKHRRAELAFRSLALRVAAFDPYLSEFESTARIELKREMAEIFFSSDINSDGSRPTSLRDLRDLEKILVPLEGLLDRVRSIVTKTA